nr:uncharacterized protein LOC121120071 [Lepeophtheirus salmonis]
MGERRNGAVEYLKQLSVSKGNATAYSKGSITMQCVQLTEEGYKITGIQNNAAYNTSITWRKEAKLPYVSASGLSLIFDEEVLKDNATNHNVMLFNAYKITTSLVFFTQRLFTSEGHMNYSHTNAASKTTFYTLYKKQE